MNKLNDQFDIVVISLPERSDRRRDLRAQFDANGIEWSTVRIFDGIRTSSAAGFPTVGAHGCFLSHLAVLKDHIASTRPLLVCEDDLDLDPHFADRIGDVIAELQIIPWDLFFFGAHLCGQPVEHLAVRNPASKLSHLHMVAYRPEVLLRLTRYLDGLLNGTNETGLGPMHVDDAIALFRRDNPDVTTRVAIPPLGNQRASLSDIQERAWYDHIPVVRAITPGLRWVKNRLRGHGIWDRKPTA